MTQSPFITKTWRLFNRGCSHTSTNPCGACVKLLYVWIVYPRMSVSETTNLCSHPNSSSSSHTLSDQTWGTIYANASAQNNGNTPKQHIPAVQPNSTVYSKQCQHYESTTASCYANEGYISQWICGMHDWTNTSPIDASYSCLLRCLKPQWAGDPRDSPSLVESDTKTNTATKLWLCLLLNRIFILKWLKM